MATPQVQFRKGNTTEHAQFTGANAEITVDTQKKRLSFMTVMMLEDLNSKEQDGNMQRLINN